MKMTFLKHLLATCRQASTDAEVEAIPPGASRRMDFVRGCAALVIPTYNERDNLPLLVEAIMALPVAMRIIVVDDHSPDGTGALADGLAAQGVLEVIHRPGKLGLGTAYAAGFRRALVAGADPILTMDADFSHDPKYVPVLLGLSRQYDLVIGSRYVAGGGVRHWGASRRLLSWGANCLARHLIGLRARDCTAGFRCYRRAVLEAIDLEAIRANGYSYLLEMLFHCQRLGFRIGETPIVFVDRCRGKSKISRREIAKAVKTLARLAARRWIGARRHLRAVPGRADLEEGRGR